MIRYKSIISINKNMPQYSIYEVLRICTCTKTGSLFIIKASASYNNYVYVLVIEGPVIYQSYLALLTDGQTSVKRDTDFLAQGAFKPQ